VMRALHWPDAFWAADPELQRAAGVRGTEALHRMAERWRPWRSYAAAHLRREEQSGGQAVTTRTAKGELESNFRAHSPRRACPEQ
jgi:3-methyladenine DNA glycosylase/8-oxoguanine DNA glycosylase